MLVVKLSIEEAIIKWATFWVDWFMNLFADPDYYWVQETYPSNKQQGKIELSIEEPEHKTVLKTIKKLIKTPTYAMLQIINNSYRNHLKPTRSWTKINRQLTKTRLVKFSVINI